MGLARSAKHTRMAGRVGLTTTAMSDTRPIKFRCLCDQPNSVPIGIRASCRSTGSELTGAPANLLHGGVDGWQLHAG